jgi:hypothetical protein
MLETERLMNLMEHLEYKSEQYKLCREALMEHMKKKPPQQEDDDGGDVVAWEMTGPAPL